MSTPDISQLAASINTNVKMIDTFLRTNGLPRPTWDIDAPRGLPRDAQVERAREQILSAIEDLRSLILGPAEQLQVMGESHSDLISLHAIQRLDIASKIPVGESISYSEAAMLCNISEQAMRQLLRHSMASHIFCDIGDASIAHTAASRLLAEDEVSRDFVDVAVNELWPAAPKVVEALQKWPLSEEPSDTAFSLAHDDPAPFYEVIRKSAARAQRFANAMRAYASQGSYSEAQILTTLDWAALGPATVVDVGGSHGSIAFALTKKYPELKLIVQDTAEVLASRPPNPDLELESRVTFMPHDFFNVQPVHGADVYYLRWVLHNWADGYAVQILRGLLPALKDGARVLVHEQCLPALSTPSFRSSDRVKGGIGRGSWATRRLCAMNICQLELFNSRERSIPQWGALLKLADERFKLIRVAGVDDGAPLGVIEVQWNLAEK